MTDRRKALATFFAVLVAISAAIAVGVSKTASAAPSLICTWTGATNNDISVANNWSPPNTGQTCGGSVTTSGSAQLSGAELVFPSPVPATGSMLTLDASESVDDLVFEDGYVISGSNTLTLTPSANGSVGIDVASGAGPTITAPMVLGQSQTFAVPSGKSLYLGGAISGSNDSLTFGNPGNTGYIELDVVNSYSGGTTVAYGSAEIKNSQSLGTGVVTVDSGASLLEYSGSGTVDPTNSLTLSGSGSAGYAGALEDYTGDSIRSGPITLAGSVTLAAESKANPFAITGSIGGTGPLALSGTGTFKFSGGSSNFSGATTIVSQTTLISGVANALPSTTSLTVGSSASYDLNSYAQTITGLSGSGSVTSSPATATTLTISPSGTDSVGTAITGNIGLAVAGSGTVILGSSSNAYTQNTKVLSGILQNGAANAVPSGSSISVASSGSFDLAGFNQSFLEITGPGVITSSSGTPLLSVDIGSGVSDTWSGTLTGSLGLATSGSGTLVVSSLGNSYSGATSVSSGMAEINGSVTNSVFAVSAGATLEGSGTVGGISSNAGVVHPGTSPGILTSNGASTLGSGTLAIDITGSQAGSGYSQLVATGNSVDVSGTTLSVSDSYAAAYDSVFTIVSGGSVTGTFSNVAWGANLAVGGRSLLLGKTSNAITLTDVTDPPPAPAPTSSGPVPPLPPSGAVSYTGAS